MRREVASRVRLQVVVAQCFAWKQLNKEKMYNKTSVVYLFAVSFI